MAVRSVGEGDDGGRRKKTLSRRTVENKVESIIYLLTVSSLTNNQSIFSFFFAKDI